MQSGSPAVKTIMHQYGLTLETVSNRAGCTLVETYKALDLRQFSRSPLLVIVKVRSAVEEELSGCGWNGRKKALWGEFDITLAQLLEAKR